MRRSCRFSLPSVCNGLLMQQQTTAKITMINNAMILKMMTLTITETTITPTNNNNKQ